MSLHNAKLVLEQILQREHSLSSCSCKAIKLKKAAASSQLNGLLKAWSESRFWPVGRVGFFGCCLFVLNKIQTTTFSYCWFTKDNFWYHLWLVWVIMANNDDANKARKELIAYVYLICSVCGRVIQKEE